jgi:hypothetical protein
MNYFFVPSAWKIPETALQRSLEEMAIDGAVGREGVTMWLGSYERETASITHVAVLRGPGVRKAPKFLQISSDLVNDLTDVAIERGLTLIGQIHSHGAYFGTDLSPTDRLNGISVPGYLSVVAPDYAMRPATTISECGVHIFEQRTGWRRFSPPEITQRIRMTRGIAVPVLVVGDKSA